MLLFTPLALPGLTAFPDHLGGTAYYLPPALDLLPRADGSPDFFLFRYHGDFATASGGLLRFRLGFRRPDAQALDVAESAGLRPREVGFEAARFRLRVQVPQDGTPPPDPGDWHAATPGAGELAAPAVGLTPRETQFLAALLTDAAAGLAVDLDLRYAGLVPGLPWLVSAKPEARALLAALLPASPASAEQVAAAFLSMPTSGGDSFDFRALEAGAAFPGRDALLREAALRSLDALFDRDPRTDPFAPAAYRLRPAPVPATPLAWDLIPPRQETRAHALSWEVGPFVRGLTPEARRALFPSTSAVSPFAAVTIHVINRVPYDPNYLRRAMVDLRFTGPSGTPEIRSATFDGTADLAEFQTFYPAAAADFRLAARVTTTLAPPPGGGWPVVRVGPFVPADGLVVEVSRAAVGMDFVRVEVEPAAFDKAAAVTVTLSGSAAGAAPLAVCELTAARPAAWVALPGLDHAAEINAEVTARPPADSGLSPKALWSGPAIDRQVRVGAYRLEVLDPDRVTATLAPGAAARFALVRLTVAPLTGEGRTQALTNGEPAAWNVFRDSVFAPLRFRYRVDYVPLDAAGHPLPLASTDWVDADAPALVVSPPAAAPGAPP